MGRPKSKKPKTNYIKLRLNDEEKDAFLKRLDESDYKYMSELIIDTVVNGKYHTKNASPDVQKFIQLGRYASQIRYLGNNLNQLLKVLHSKKAKYVRPEELKKIFTLINNTKKTIDWSQKHI